LIFDYNDKTYRGGEYYDAAVSNNYYHNEDYGSHCMTEDDFSIEYDIDDMLFRDCSNHDITMVLFSTPDDEQCINDKTSN
jgi:hypothetical protein